MNFYFHIGFPKTGTTTLQNTIYPLICKNKNCLYLGKFSRTKENKKFLCDGKIIDCLIYSTPQKLFSLLEKEKDFFQDNYGKNFILSDERLLQASMSITNKSERMRRILPKPIIKWPDYRTTALNIQQMSKYLNKTPKIIITLRRQDDLLFSWYGQKYNTFKQKSFSKFLPFILDTCKNDFIDHVLHYNYLVDFYIQLFGHDNVHVLIYEELLNSPEIFSKKLSSIFNFEETIIKKQFITNNINDNKFNDSSRYVKGSKILSEFNKVLALVNCKIPNKIINITEQERSLILQRYRNSNIELANNLKINLKQYGYY